jgi:hypothetical protein
MINSFGTQLNEVLILAMFIRGFCRNAFKRCEILLLLPSLALFCPSISICPQTWIEQSLQCFEWNPGQSPHCEMLLSAQFLWSAGIDQESSWELPQVVSWVHVWRSSIGQSDTYCFRFVHWLCSWEWISHYFVLQQWSLVSVFFTILLSHYWHNFRDASDLWPKC